MGTRPRISNFTNQKVIRPFFLLEVLIGIALSSILLTLLFRFLVSYATIESRIEKAQIILLERERIQEKLEGIFTSIEPASLEGPSFYTLQFPEEKSTSLVLLYDAGIDPDPTFSGPVTCRLYLNERNEFCLTQWNKPRDDYRTEVLLKNVTALDWELLGHKQENDTKAIPIAGTWAYLPAWPKNLSKIPSIIRVKLWCGIDKKRKSGPNLQFAFILPTQEPIQILK